MTSLPALALLGFVGVAFASQAEIGVPRPRGLHSTARHPPAQEGARFSQFDDWFRRYREGRIYFLSPGGRLPAGARLDTFERDGELARVLLDCLRVRGRAAAERLLALAAFRFASEDAVEQSRFGAHAPWRVRERALAALSQLSDEETLEYLTRDVLLGRDRVAPGKRAVAASALGTLGAKSALTALYSAASDPEAAVRDAAIGAAIVVGGPRASVLLRWLSDPSPEVRLRVLDAVARSIETHKHNGEAVELQGALLRCLQDEDWRVRDRTVEIVSLQPTKAAIAALIAALQKEADLLASGAGRKRVQIRIGEALGKITGVEIPTLDAARWAKWWEVAAGSFQLGSEVTGRPHTRADGPAYFTIPIQTDRMVFMVDVSSSMAECYGAPPVVSGPAEPLAYSPKEGVWTKLDRVKNELIKTVRSLRDTDRFQIIVFSDSTKASFSRLEAATKDRKREAERFLSGLKPAGGTGLYDALADVLPLEGAPVGVSADSPDTLFLLTDGEPTVGRVVDKSEILRRVADANRISRVAIHTIFVGAADGASGSFLTELAQSNGGIHRKVGER
ncbi:MAG: HEAT repeat domain-containing protein [Planctomycetes bacterium]|nr:HEAT repeat domain-containing protein [Planctomycetota bacterium]